MKILKSFILLLEDQSEKIGDLLLITENGPTRFESVRFFRSHRRFFTPRLQGERRFVFGLLRDCFPSAFFLNGDVFFSCAWSF